MQFAGQIPGTYCLLRVEEQAVQGKTINVEWKVVYGLGLCMKQWKKYKLNVNWNAGGQVKHKP